jgi:hypothetical protein
MDWATSVLDTADKPAAGKVDFAAQAFSAPDEPNQPIGEGKDAGLYGSFVSGFSSGDAETVRFLASRLYPNEPLETAVKRFGQRDGVIFHKADDGKLYRAEGDSALSDIVRGAGKALPVGAGTAAGILTAPLAATGIGLAGTVAATAGAAGAGELARQKIGDVLMGDASTSDVDPLSVAQEGAMAGLGQGIGAGITGLVTRSAVPDIARFDPASTARAYRDAQRAGVDITPAEATGLPTLAAQQKRLTNITPTADKMRDFLTERSRQVTEAWSDMLDGISRSGDAEDVGQAGRKAAGGVLDDMRKALSRQAKPYYDAAYEKPVPFSRDLEDLLKRPVMTDALRKAKTLSANEDIASKQFFAEIADDGTVSMSRVPDMREWDYIKRGLDEIIGSGAARNEQTGGLNNLGRIVTGIKKNLVGMLDDAVPEYATARKIYSEGAEDVTGAMQSAMNILAKTKDTNILRAAKHIFDPKARSPAMVRKLRTAIEAKDPEAWAGLKRLYMQDVTTDALRIAESGDVINPAGKLFKAFSNPRIRANLQAAMTRGEWNRMNDLLVVFRRASSVPALRSDTEFNRLMTKEAEDAARPVLAKIARNANPAQALRSVENWLTNRSLNRHAEQVVDLVTSGDPQAIAAMKELRRLSPKDQRWIALFGHLLARGGEFAAGSILPPADHEPAQ